MAELFHGVEIVKHTLGSTDGFEYLKVVLSCINWPQNFRGKLWRFTFPRIGVVLVANSLPF
jgi:hypothetical protein